MSRDKLGIADYPLAERRPELVRGRRGKGLAELTLDLVLSALPDAPVAPIDVSAANASDREELIDEPAAPVVLDYAPSVEPVKTASGEAIEENQPAERGSYYSRRSAKLPRLGDSAGHDALGAMKSVRRASE